MNCGFSPKNSCYVLERADGDCLNSTDSRFATYCIFGAARGGTSMVAALMRLLGVNLGQHLDESSHEDKAFHQHGGDLDHFKDPFRAGKYIGSLLNTIEERNRKHDCWGWKDPMAAQYLHLLHGYLRAPRYIMVTRDISAVARGEMAHDTLKIGKFVDFGIRASQLYSDGLRWVQGAGCPAMVISYEKALLHPEDLISALAGFCKMSPSDRTLTRMLNHITPERGYGEITELQDSDSE